MDKRTIFFVLALTLSLYGVNYYFENDKQEKLREWSAQQQAKQAKQKGQLESEIATRTAAPAALPLVAIYADAEATQPLTTGVLNDSSVLTLAWTKEPPQQIFAKKIGAAGPAEAYTLAYSPRTANGALLFQKGDGAKLQIGDLPDFGQYDLQIVTLTPAAKEHPFGIYLGDFTDGHFSVPFVKLERLKSDLQKEEITAEKNVKLGDGIALLKTADGYLPVALYIDSEKKLLDLDDITGLAELTVKPATKKAVTATQKTEERFYVLENGYQQLVFSNYGGALVEINLPFQTKKDVESVVKEIEFDREMVAKYPYNAMFPAHAYSTPGAKPQGPYIEHAQGTLGGYYPLLRRDLIQTGGRKSIRVPPRFYAMNILSEYPEVAEYVYEVKRFDSTTIVFETVQSHRRITKTFSISSEEKGAPYCVDVTINVEGDARGLWISSGVPEVEWISGAPAPALKYRITRNSKSEVISINLPQDAETYSNLYPNWICNSNGFLGMIIDPLTAIDPGFRVQGVSGVTVPSRLLEFNQGYEQYKAQDLPGYLVLLPLKATGGTMNFRFFSGPFADSVLKTVDKTYSDPSTGYNPDYIACQTFHGWFSFISEPFAKFLFILMNFFHDITGSWALSIVLLTVALRLMMYPLNTWSTKSMIKMQQIGPEVAALQEKYKKDPKKAQVEIMNLYRERGVNPVSGCLPLLIQMPFLIGMFDLLKSTFELRGASFIPGWIDNLTAPDVLFSWSTPIFFIGTQFHLLPILLGLVMYLQQKMMSTAPKDPSLMTDQQRQQKAMGPMMAILFAVMFYNFPSGLNIYWLSSMLLGILQQWWTMRQMAKPAVAVTLKKTSK